MYIVKTNPIGVDKSIQNIQTFLHDKLIDKWGVSSNDAMFYGRSYKNKTSDGYIPEVYTSNNTYKEVLLDSALAVQSFFSIKDEILFNGQESTAKTSLYFLVNLSKITVYDAATRNDEEVHRDILKAFSAGFRNLNITKQVIGINRVFEDYSGTILKNADYDDMHPYHCFRLDFDLSYSNINC